jgi:polyisoprenyl-teichoic acid--peptidoglycan teichoic acid transferase
LKRIAILLFILLTTGILAFLLYRNFTLGNELDRLAASITGGLEQTRTQMDRATENLNLLAGGTNQMRLRNGLPPLAFDYGEETADAAEEMDPELIREKQKDVFYEALDYLLQVNGDYDARASFEANILNEALQRWLTTQSVTWRFTSTLSGTLSRNGAKIMDFVVNDDGTAELKDIYGREASADNGGEFTEFVKNYDGTLKEIRDHVALWSANLDAFPRRDDLQQTIREKELSLRTEDSEDRHEMLIRLSDWIVKEKAGVIKGTGELYLGNVTYGDWNSFESDLLAYLKGLDGRTDRQVRDDEVKAFLLSVIGEKAFTDYLDQHGLVLSPEIRESEDTDYFNWDFTDKEGKRMGSFALLKGMGEIYLLDGDDVVLRSFRTLTDNHVTVDLDNSWKGAEVGVISDVYSSAEEETYLVVGSHEKNADTIILVHVNSRDDTIKMISIPRDLWFKNRKLNSVYRYYGIDALAADVSELTGMEINKYMAIDMYAFVDVINILGGIDIVLEEPLADPTYHIKENGVWATLDYPAGPIHLDGLGALRVARSRHSTNDYSRSRRQQLIIEAIFAKLTGMGLSDMDKLAEFVKAAVKYTETNISPGTLMMDVMKYKNGDLESRNVIDATNVLYESYSNLYRLSKEEQAAALADDNYYLGAWIVLPRDNNYNLIKWHIREIISK